jgi:hypothetical protein
MSTFFRIGSRSAAYARPRFSGCRGGGFDLIPSSRPAIWRAARGRSTTSGTTTAAPTANPAPPQVLLAHHLRQLKLLTFLRYANMTRSPPRPPARGSTITAIFCASPSSNSSIVKAHGRTPHSRAAKCPYKCSQAAQACRLAFPAGKSFDTFDFAAISVAQQAARSRTPLRCPFHRASPAGTFGRLRPAREYLVARENIVALDSCPRQFRHGRS